MIPEAGSTLTQSYRPVFPKTTYFCLPSPAQAVMERILLNLSKVTSPLGWHQACAALGHGVLSLRATKNSSYNRNSRLRLPCSLLATHRDSLSNEEGWKIALAPSYGITRWERNLRNSSAVSGMDLTQVLPLEGPSVLLPTAKGGQTRQ